MPHFTPNSMSNAVPDSMSNATMDSAIPTASGILMRSRDGSQIRGSLTAPLSIPHPCSGKDLLAYLLEPSGPLTIEAQSDLYSQVTSGALQTTYCVQDFADDTGNEVRFFDSAVLSRFVWLRLTLADGEAIEGRVANSLEGLTGQWLVVYPVDCHSNTECILVSRTAIAELQVISTRE